MNNKIFYRVLNYNKIVTIHQPKTILDQIKIGFQLFYRTIYQGTLSCFQDYKLIQSFHNQRNAQQLYQEYIIKRELIKAIPFIIIFILPGSAAMLIPYVAIFPHAIPTNYLFEHQYQQRINRKIHLQEKAAFTLYKQQKIIIGIKNNYELKEIFINKRYLFDTQLNINNLSSDQLNLICQLLQLEYFQILHGFNQIYHFCFNWHNQLYNLIQQYLFKSSKRRQYINPYSIININRPFFIEIIRKKILLYQIENYFQYINFQDQLYNENIQFQQYYAEQRGLPGYIGQINFFRDWIQFNQINNLTLTQKIWYSVLYQQLQTKN